MVGMTATRRQCKRNGDRYGWLGDEPLGDGQPDDGLREGLAMNNLMLKQWGWMS
jgi:hypothetical protein